MPGAALLGLPRPGHPQQHVQHHSDILVRRGLHPARQHHGEDDQVPDGRRLDRRPAALSA